MSCRPFGRHCSRSTECGCHVACALIGTNCFATAGRNRGCNAATRSAVAPRINLNNKRLTTSEWPTKILTTRRDRYDAATQNQNNCAVTHLGGRDTSAFVIPSAAIARSLSSTLVASTVL